MQVKSEIINMLEPGQRLYNCSTYLSEKLQSNYTYLSAVFSEYFGVTIEHYLICCRIDKAKDMIKKGDRKIAEIAHVIGYRSAAHFSSQFRQVEGIPPSKYRQMVMAEKEKAG